jgi:hypothetical protein
MKVRNRNPLRVAAGSLILGLLLASGSAFAIGLHDEGCTPGYWKAPQHFDSWPAGHLPTDNLRAFFGGLAYNDTVINALNYGGGPGIDGAKQILFRAAVAARLNAFSDSIDYPISPGTLRTLVEAALATNDRADILELAADLDAMNNLSCPLN